MAALRESHKTTRLTSPLLLSPFFISLTIDLLFKIPTFILHFFLSPVVLNELLDKLHSDPIHPLP